METPAWLYLILHAMKWPAERWRRRYIWENSRTSASTDPKAFNPSHRTPADDYRIDW